MAGIRIFEGMFMISAVLVIYGLITSCCFSTCILIPILYFCYSVIQKKSIKWIKTEDKHVLITGCDSGFGNGLAKYLDDLGVSVLATCYDDKSPGAIKLKKIGSDKLHVIRMDVGKDDSVKECLEKVEEICGEAGLWGVVNNAGINFLGDIELCTMKQYLDIANVNMYGMVRVSKAFLPLLRKQSEMVVLNGATGCLNEEGASRIKKDMDIMWEKASQEIKEVYGQEYHEGLYNAAKESAITTCPTLQPVLNALKDALLNEEPQTRYMIQGGKGFYDYYSIQAKLNSVLPTCIMDKWIYKNFLQGLPPLKALSGKDKQE